MLAAIFGPIITLPSSATRPCEILCTIEMSVCMHLVQHDLQLSGTGKAGARQIWPHLAGIDAGSLFPRLALGPLAPSAVHELHQLAVLHKPVQDLGAVLVTDPLPQHASCEDAGR